MWSFQAVDTKLERYLDMNQHTKRKLLSFVLWINDELSKIWYNFGIYIEVEVIIYFVMILHLITVMGDSD